MTVRLTTENGENKYFDSEEDCLEFYNTYARAFEIRKCDDGNELWQRTQGRRVGVFSPAPSAGFF